MHDVNRLTAEEFFGWQRLVDGRYELIDGHITPHPDFVTPLGFAAPDADHGAICANLVALLRAGLRPPCRVSAGAGTVVDRVNANVPDLAVSRAEADRERAALEEPRFVFEVSSPKTARVDTGRKVADSLAIASLVAYGYVDRARRAVTVYRPDAAPQSYASGTIALGDDVAFDVAEVFA